MKVALGQLEENGVLAVISFHSLEDNIVYKYMKDFVKNM
jgi:16S rRNA C1402 N4-methylase RsmH